jgi:ABC-type nitrate/sulfonate/bicarbonate transport system substrate-binding protein
MEPLVSRAREKGARTIADLRWRGGIVASDEVDEETAAKLRRALNRAIDWLRQSENRSRDQVLRDLTPAQREQGMMPELVGVGAYRPDEFKQKVDWMMDRGFLKEPPEYHDVVRSE